MLVTHWVRLTKPCFCESAFVTEVDSIFVVSQVSPPPSLCLILSLSLSRHSTDHSLSIFLHCACISSDVRRVQRVVSARYLPGRFIKLCGKFAGLSLTERLRAKGKGNGCAAPGHQGMKWNFSVGPCVSSLGPLTAVALSRFKTNHLP